LIAVKVAAAQAQGAAKSSHGRALRCEPARRTEHPHAHLSDRRTTTDGPMTCLDNTMAG